MIPRPNSRHSNGALQRPQPELFRATPTTLYPDGCYRTFVGFLLAATALLSAASCGAAFLGHTELDIGLGAASLLSMFAGIPLWTRQD